MTLLVDTGIRPTVDASYPLADARAGVRAARRRRRLRQARPHPRLTSPETGVSARRRARGRHVSARRGVPGRAARLAWVDGEHEGCDAGSRRPDDPTAPPRPGTRSRISRSGTTGYGAAAGARISTRSSPRRRTRPRATARSRSGWSAEGRAHAALVFDGDVAVGWCQYGAPRGAAEHQPPQGVRGGRGAATRLPADLLLHRHAVSAPGRVRGRPARRPGADRRRRAAASSRRTRRTPPASRSPPRSSTAAPAASSSRPGSPTRAPRARTTA